MANMAHYEFDSSQVEPAQGDLPEGEFLVSVIQTEIKTTKAGDGDILVVQYQVLNGPYAGRIIYENINLVNPSQIAVTIGRQALSALCRSVGIFSALNDSDDLCDKTLIVRLKLRKGDERVSVSGHKPVEEGVAATPPAANPAVVADKPTQAAASARPAFLGSGK